jgi:NADPH2:quinone reductase
MRAIAVDRLGAEPALVDLPEPAAGPGQLKLQVRAAGVNPLDLKIASGQMPIDPSLPLVLGFDVVGRVIEIGDGAEGFELGDEVFGLSRPDPLGAGTYAEQTVIDASPTFGRVPAALGFELAAELPMPAGTALDLVERQLQLGHGATLGVIGAAGAVGAYVVQLAASAGIQVVAVARSADRSRLEQYGAAKVIDRDAGDVADLLRDAVPGGLDAMIDSASDASGVAHLAPTVRSGGRYVSLVRAADADALRAHGLEAINSTYVAAAGDADRLAEMVVEGQLQCPPHQTVTLDEAVDALARMASGELKTKLVICP